MNEKLNQAEEKSSENLEIEPPDSNNQLAFITSPKLFLALAAFGGGLLILSSSIPRKGN
jgi:hypothetical protein